VRDEFHRALHNLFTNISCIPSVTCHKRPTNPPSAHVTIKSGGLFALHNPILKKGGLFMSAVTCCCFLSLTLWDLRFIGILYQKFRTKLHIHRRPQKNRKIATSVTSRPIEVASSENNQASHAPRACQGLARSRIIRVRLRTSAAIFISWGDRAMAVKAFVSQSRAGSLYLCSSPSRYLSEFCTKLHNPACFSKTTRFRPWRGRDAPCAQLCTRMHKAPCF
jgi:hypothetical protein